MEEAPCAQLSPLDQAFADNPFTLAPPSSSASSSSSSSSSSSARAPWLPEDELPEDSAAEIPFSTEHAEIIDVPVTRDGVMQRPKFFESHDTFFVNPSARVLLHFRGETGTHWQRLFKNFRRNSTAPWATEGFFYKALIDSIMHEFYGCVDFFSCLQRKARSYPRTRAIAFHRIRSIVAFFNKQNDLNDFVDQYHEPLVDLYLALCVVMQL